ncbi:histidine phosphatase family protein [Alicyclobacillus dauci]|uniref:Histidine phosphatase family protein n=1 Tax=Alicyclobacillus dauci TaxID=1475485 RepID=A0ABY6Z836_9BACL|nr:histidine phosphatase family protein [Alicyclobacillus dauci]WAH38863.1 histidine phosphatase family protein [Alicyclobacillus dauci]
MKVYLVRHGHATLNMEGAADRFCGRTDVPLSERGRAQARELGKVLRAQGISRIYHSGLQRSIQTAEIILGEFSDNRARVDLSLAEGMQEVPFGEWEGKTKAEVRSLDSVLYEQWEKQPASTVIPGARPFLPLYEAAIASLSALKGLHNQENIVVVGHSTINRLILIGLLGADLNKYRIIRQDNCAINVLEFKEGSAVTLEKVNWTAL